MKLNITDEGRHFLIHVDLLLKWLFGITNDWLFKTAGSFNRGDRWHCFDSTLFCSFSNRVGVGRGCGHYRQRFAVQGLHGQCSSRFQHRCKCFYMDIFIFHTSTCRLGSRSALASVWLKNIAKICKVLIANIQRQKSQERKRPYSMFNEVFHIDQNLKMA